MIKMCTIKCCQARVNNLHLGKLQVINLLYWYNVCYGQIKMPSQQNSWLSFGNRGDRDLFTSPGSMPNNGSTMMGQPSNMNQLRITYRDPHTFQQEFHPSTIQSQLQKPLITYPKTTQSQLKSSKSFTQHKPLRSI